MSHVKENTSKGGEFLTIFFLFNFWWQEFRWEIEHQSIEVSFQNFCQENLVSLVPNCPASSHKITYNLKVWLCYPAKGQLISKCPFGVKISSKKTNKFFSRISALASKKRSNQKNKGTFGGFHFDSLTLLFWFDLFLEARAEMQKYFRSNFGSNENLFSRFTDLYLPSL